MSAGESIDGEVLDKLDVIGKLTFCARRVKSQQLNQLS